MHDELASSPAGCCARVENRRRLGGQRRLSHLKSKRKQNEKNEKEENPQQPVWKTQKKSRQRKCKRQPLAVRFCFFCLITMPELGTIRFCLAAASSLIGSFGVLLVFGAEQKLSAQWRRLRWGANNGGCLCLFVSFFSTGVSLLSAKLLTRH